MHYLNSIKPVQIPYESQEHHSQMEQEFREYHLRR